MSAEKNIAFLDDALTSRTAIIDRADERLDKQLARLLPDLSRSRVQGLIAAGQLYASGIAITSPAATLPEGTEVTLGVPELASSTILPEKIPLDIVYEDEDLLVVNKAAGMSVHPAPGHYSGTLVNALLAHCGESLSGIGGVARPGIVHRIDKDTTGLLVVAKNDITHQHLSAQLAARTLKRQYLAFVWGVPALSEGLIDAPLGRHRVRRQEMAVNQDGREARTQYRMLEHYGKLASLVECRLQTGRTHQIRVHMRHLGHPLMGDATYGRAAPSNAPEAVKTKLEGFQRQALHAYRLILRHPANGKLLRCEAPLAADMAELHAVLRGSNAVTGIAPGT